MIGIPPDALPAAIGRAPPSERQKLRQRFNDLRGKPPANSSSTSARRRSQKYSEVWEVHIDSDNSVTLKIGPASGNPPTASSSAAPTSSPTASSPPPRSRGSPRASSSSASPGPTPTCEPANRSQRSEVCSHGPEARMGRHQADRVRKLGYSETWPLIRAGILRDKESSKAMADYQPPRPRPP